MLYTLNLGYAKASSWASSSSGAEVSTLTATGILLAAEWLAAVAAVVAAGPEADASADVAAEVEAVCAAEAEDEAEAGRTAEAEAVHGMEGDNEAAA